MLESRFAEDEQGREVLQYLVKWKDYDSSENSWEPSENLEGAPRLVLQFHAAYPDSPKPTRAPRTTKRKRRTRQ